MYNFFNITLHLYCIGLLGYSFYMKTAYGSPWKNIVRILAVAPVLIWAIIIGESINITNIFKLFS